MSGHRSGLNRRLGIAFRVACIAATVTALWWFLHGIDVKTLVETFHRAMLWPLVLAALLNIGSHCVRAEGWRVMLGPRHRIPFGRLLRYELAAQAASAISPARAGEVLRFWLLRQDAVPAATTGALIVLKKVLGAVGLAVLVTAAPWLLPALPHWIRGFVAVFAALMVIELVTLVFVAHRVAPDKLPKFLRGLIGGMYFLRDSRRMFRALAVMLVGEAADAAAAGAVLYALGIDLPIAAAVMVLFFIDFSNMMPIAPGHLGTFEAGALYSLNLLHVSPDAAFAFALLFHAQQVLPQIVVGLPFELRLLTRRQRGSGAVLAEEDAALAEEGEHSGAGQRRSAD
ncbi:lysylphosphatidylglycerol synthase transmembrane domain-containing protein [Streptomyces sioyaensis]|uniref:lysylphosphatidylglycerol synthase transmembrane domain-containing protein n=1 Tax=Streptomyces sioyaensis TaxID=67364 RepID=UPI0036AC99DC